MTNFDFGAFPPEINSAKMYAGPGSSPMLAAASAWSGLAADLRSQAAAYRSVISGLTSDGWRGPASTAMSAAAAPYAAWMDTTAAQAEQTANQATAAAAAYEAAFGMTVPPPVIAANRAQLASLVATNILGQNTPAIAATEAQYGEMWAQDAAAMYGYAGSSAAATQVTPFTAPQQTTTTAGLAGQAAAVTQATGSSAGSNTQTALSQLTTAIPTALQQLGSPAGGSTSSTTSSWLGSLLDPNANFWNTITSTGAVNPAQVVQTITSSTLLGAGAGTMADSGSIAGISPLAMAAGLGSSTQAAPSIAGLGGAGASVSAGMGQASSLGTLSVPPAWTATAPPVTPLGSTLGGTPLAAPSSVATGMPFAPAGMGERAGTGGAIADTRFLIRPPMVPPWSAAV